MAGNKQRFTYEINADIGQAKKAINDLQRSIDNLSKKQISTNYLDTGINKAVNSAKELQYHLNKALNADTGKLNLNAFSQSLTQSNLSAKDLMQNLLQGGAAGQQAFTSLAGVIAQSEVPLKRMNSTLKNFATTLKNTIKWEISSTMIHGLERSLRGAVSYAKNLNTSLTNIRIVTGQSVDDMARFAKEANVAAKALSTTTKSYADASLIYYQQGDSQEMAAKKAAITIKAANSSFETSAKEMSEYLTAVWNSYQVGADELERYVDIMASLGAKTATSLEEIATSMQKVAATANTVGVSMEQVSSIIATVSSVTRESAESIGTSYKTIFARIGDLKLGNVDEDGVGLGQVSSQLDAIGVKILDESGNLREMGDIIVDLGTKWQTMNQAQKTAVAQVVAGKRQYTQLMALFENWPMYMQNMQIAESSEGALQKMQDTYAESWQAASDKVKASLESIYGQIFKDQTIIKLMDNTSSLIETIDKVIQGFGGIGGVLKTLGALSITVFKTQIGNSINQVLKNIKMFVTQFKGQNILQIGQSLSSGSAKNVEQLQLQARTKEWSNLFSSMKSTNEVEQIALQNSTSLLSAKDQLIAAEHKLTQAQKDRAVFTLEQLSQEQNKLLALAQERQALEQQSASNRKSGYLQTTTAIVNNRNVSREYAQGVLNDVYKADGGFEGALKTYEQNAYTITAASNIKSTLATTNNLQAAIEQVKKSLSKQITTDFLEDPKLDAEALTKKLQEVITIAEQANNTLYDKARNVKGGQQQARTAFNTAQENAEQRYNVESQMTGLERSVAGIKSTFTQLLNPASEASKTLGSTLAKVAGTAMSVAGAMSSAGSMVRAFTSDTFSLTSALSSFSGVAMNLAMGFSTGGIWGLVATGLATVIGAISESLKVQKELEQKKFEEASSLSSERVSRVVEEEKELQTLLSNYNDLYSRYQAGEEVQNELSASASALADAYGITGAAVASVTGNFENFNNEIIKTLDLSKELQDAKIAKGLAANTLQMHQVDKNNLQQDFSSLLNPEEVARGIQTAAETATIGDIQSKIFAQNKNLTLTDLIATGTDARGKMVSGSQLEKILSLDPSGFIEFITDIAEDVKGIQLTEGWVNPNGLKSVSYGKKQQYDQDGNRIYNQDEIAGFLSANQNIIGSNTLEDYLEIYLENYLMSANLNPEDLVQAWEVAADAFNTTIEPEAFSSILKTEDQDFTKLFSNNKLMWDNDASINDKIQNFEELQALEEHLIELMSSETLGENTKNTVSNLLKEVQVITKDETLSKAVADYQQAAMSEAIFNNAKSLIDQTIGKGVADVSLEEYQTIWNQIDEEVSKNAETYKLDVNADDYEQAKNKVIAGIINDYTILDEWTNVYLSLAETFKNEEQFDSAKSYIQSKKDFKPSNLTASVLNAMKLEVLSGDIQEDGLTDRALAAEQMKAINLETQKKYDKTKQVAASYDKTLELSDATSISETFFNENLNLINFHQKSWKEFLDLDADARKTYLQQVSEAYLKQAKQEAQDALAAYEREKTTFENSKAGEMFNNAQAQKLVENIYVDEKGAPRLNKNADPNEIVSLQEEVLPSYGFEVNPEGLKAFLESMALAEAKSKEIDANIASAENTLQGYELMDTDNDRAVDKINRMKEAISQLPKDMKEFDKLVKQLDNIDPAKLIEMSDLERAEEILQHLEQPTEAQFTKWNPETQENDFDAAGYAEAMQAYEEARKSAVDVIMNSANEAFTQIENRMNAARTEAEKTKTIAESLSGAIKTGELTETQKLGMSQTLVDNWGKASNATERAAIAAQQWANYGTEIANAGKEAADAYVAAGVALDKTIKDAKANNATDLLTFDFSNKETGKTDFGKFIQNIVTDPSLRAIWNKGFEDLISHTDISNMSDLGILEAVKAEIQKTGKVTQTEFDQILAGVKDSIVSMYSTLGEQEASLAQQVVNEWESAFKQIANLRRSIIMGDDIGSDLTASLQDYVKYANAYTGQGSLAEAYKSGNLTANQMSLGSSEGLTEKLLASMGLANDKWEVYEGDDGFLYQKQTKDYYDLFDSKGGETVLKGIDALAAQFNISKIDKDEATYEKAVREAVAPFIRNLLSQSDLDATTIDAKVNEFLNGSITAEETINQAANKMLGLAGEYATLLESNQQLAEADAQFKATQEEQTKIQTEAQNYAKVTESIMELKPEDRNAGKIAEVLSNAGISSTDYISSMRDKGFGVSSLNDIANLSNESLERYENYLQQDALKAGQTIVSAAQEFKSIVTNSQEEGGLGYGEDSIAGETATKYLEEATNNQNSNIDAYVADTQTDMSSSIDTSLSMAGEQLGALQALDKVKQGTSEWAQGLDELYSAYSHLEGAEKIINQLADGTINLNEANDQLVDLTLKATDNVYDFSDAQWDLYKKTLRTNKVVVDGYESLEDYFEAIEDGRKESKKWISEGKKFNKQLEDQKDNLDENKDGMLDYSEAADIVQKEWENLFKDGLIDEDTFEDGKRIMSEGVQGILDEANRIIDAHPEYDFTEGLRQAVLNYSGESAQCLADLAIMMGASADECLRLAAENSVVALQDLIVDMLGQGTLNWGNIPQLVAQINAWMSANGIAGKRLTSPSGGSRGGSGGGSRRPSSGGSGGGGGGDKQKETKELVRYKDEVERYHVQNETLERISENLDEIDKLKERAYGKDHIAQIDAETDALNEQLIAQQALHDEALKWMAADKADLSVYGAEFDDEGTIINYETVMKRIIDEYNAAIERYNNSGQGDGDKLALEAAQQRFEDAKEAIENYEEAVQIANDSANEMLEIQNQMSELEVEKITYELELKMEMNERDLEILEYYQEKYSEELENQDKLFNTFIQSAAEYEDNLAQLGKAYEDLSRQYAAGLINEAHYAEAVTELQEEIVDNLNSLQEIQSELAEAYSETLELAREEIERTTDAIDHSNEALQSFMDITRLTGNDAEYKKIGKFYDQMYANNLTKIEVQKAHLDSLLEEEERFQEKIRNGQQLTELEKAEYAALSEQIQETRDTLLSSVVESLEVVRESYENTINSIADDLDNFMAGAAGSMEYLQEQYGYFQEEQERYVSTTKELYEVSKLNREIEGTLATTTSSAAKEALKALQEKINKQSELNELTEYDIEMNQLQYQLLLARIKLEESQNAKDTVRLTRDENGNYAYRYTANQDKIDEAAQHYEDVLQQINDTTVQRTSEIEQQLLNTMSNYKEKFQEIATDYSLTEEERLMRLEELNNQFSETMRYLQEQNNIVTNNLTANQEAIAGHYGATMSEITASTAGNVNNTIQSMIDKTEEYIAAMNNAIFGEEGAQSAWQKYLAQLGDIEGSADVAYDSLLGNAQDMGEMNGFAAEEALEVIQTLRDTLDPLEALSSAWDAHNAILEATISNYENLAQVIQGALSAIGQIPNGGTANVDGAHRYAKGGLVDYTGLAWVDGTVSDPEMMLNPGDTQNILKATAMVKSLDSGFIGSLVESVKSAAAAMLHMFGGAYHAITNVRTANDSALDQNVHITAEFPNVQNHTEIEEAFDNLINQAAQFAHRKN